MSTQPKEQVRPSINPHNVSQVVFILEEFSIESLDVSAKGLLRILNSEQPTGMNEAVSLCLPRDYEVPVSTIQRNRVLSLIREYWGANVLQH